MKRNKRLTEAVRIAQDAEIEELEKQISEDGEHVFSADFEEKMNSLFEKKKEPSAKYQYFKRAAIAFCCLAVVLASAVFIRNSGSSGNYSLIDLLAESEMSSVYEPEYVPSGYELYSREAKKGAIKTEYRNASGDSIIFEQSKTPFDAEIPFEIQYEKYESNIIEDNQKLLRCYKKDAFTILIWNDNLLDFRVKGMSEYEEIIKMCEVKEVVIKK